MGAGALRYKVTLTSNLQPLYKPALLRFLPPPSRCLILKNTSSCNASMPCMRCNSSLRRGQEYTGLWEPITSAARRTTALGPQQQPVVHRRSINSLSISPSRFFRRDGFCDRSSHIQIHMFTRFRMRVHAPALYMSMCSHADGSCGDGGGGGSSIPNIPGDNAEMEKVQAGAIDDMEREAWELLRKAVVTYCGSPCGTIAACDPNETDALNYDQVFIRDFVPSAIAFLLDGQHEIVRNFLLHTFELQSWEKTVDCFSPGQGLMPASFKVQMVPRENGGMEETLDPDFGEAAIGRVAPVDSDTLMCKQEQRADNNISRIFSKFHSTNKQGTLPNKTGTSTDRAVQLGRSRQPKTWGSSHFTRLILRRTISIIDRP